MFMTTRSHKLEDADFAWKNLLFGDPIEGFTPELNLVMSIALMDLLRPIHVDLYMHRSNMTMLLRDNEHGWCKIQMFLPDKCLKRM